MSELKVGDVVSSNDGFGWTSRLLKTKSDLWAFLSNVVEVDDDWQLGLHESLIPEGFAIVPVAPTDEMIAAGRKECEGAAILPYHFYKAMINAAPKPTDK